MIVAKKLVPAIRRLLLLSSVSLLTLISCHRDGDDVETTENGTPIVDCRFFDETDNFECTWHLCEGQRQYQECEGSNESCDYMERCFADFYNCFEAQCHPGDSVNLNLGDYYSGCYDDYSECLDVVDTDPPVDTDTSLIPYTGPDPLAEFDCEVAGLDESLCDYDMCANREYLMDGFRCSASQSECEAYWQCLLDYQFHCYALACPSGTLKVDMDVVIGNACGSALQDCFAAL